MRRSTKGLQVAAAICALAGCATAGDGATRIETNPDGAQAQLAGGESCLTPCALRFSQRGETRLTLSKVGFKTIELRYTTDFWRRAPKTATFELELVAPTIPVEERPLSAPMR